MNRAARLATAVAAVAGGALLAGCSASSGTVTAWSWTPPVVQTVDTSCSWWSGTKQSGYCAEWNTVQVAGPQNCKLTFTSAGKTGTTVLDVGETQCMAFLGQHWPPGGTSSAPS